MKDTLCITAYVPSCYSVHYCLCTKLQGYSSLNTLPRYYIEVSGQLHALVTLNLVRVALLLMK